MKDVDIFLNAPPGATPGELEAYLDQVCEGDPELIDRVMALFKADGATEAVVDLAPKMPGQAPPDPAQEIEAEGSTIGPYKLLQKIGEGGFGAVYMAEQLKPVRRRVALKVIKLGMDTRQVVARFEAERQALAMMDHPNIAKVYDGGATGTGRPYFVMELVRGIPVTRFCDEQNLDTDERLKLFVDVCHAVQHAHQKGVIHRDLKPSNVMVTMHDDRPVVKVIDFGVAKATQSDLTDKTLFTQFEQFIGTPAYMSPEQAQFSGLDIDTRSDIYTLGVLLYELLTGTTPFDSKELVRAGQDEIRRIIKEEEPARPSARLSTLGNAELTDLAKHRKTQPAKLPGLLRGDLDWIVMKALEKDRTRRYETANALAADVNRHLNDEPVTAAAPGAAYRLAKFARKYRPLIATAAVIALALIAGTGVSLWQAAQARDARDAAQLASTAERSQRERAQRQERVARHRIAEEQFAAGESALGVAHLARLIREDATNTVAAERMLTAIRMRPLHEMLHVFDGAGVRVAKFSSDGSMVAIGSRDRTAGVFDTATGKALSPTMELTGAGRLLSVQFSPDDQKIMILQLDLGGQPTATATLFRWKTGEPVCEPLRLETQAQVGTFSPDGKLVLMGCPHEASVWDAETGERLIDPTLKNTSYTGTFSPDSRLIAFTDGRVFEARTGNRLQGFSTMGSVYSIRFSPDGGKLIGGSADGIARVWDVATGEVIEMLRHEETVVYAEFSPDGAMVLTGSRDGVLRVWDAATYHQLREFTHPAGALDGFNFAQDGAVFSADGRQVLATYAGETWAWDVHSDSGGTPLSSMPRSEEVSELGVDNRTVLTSGGVGRWGASLGRVPTHWPVSQIIRHPESSNWDTGSQAIREIDFSPDGDRLLTGPTVDVLGVWDSWTGEQLRALSHSGGIKQRADFSSDGTLILSVTIGAGVMVWDAQTQQRLTHITGEGGHRHATFSPVRDSDGDYLLVVAPEGVRSAQVYKARSGKPVGLPLTVGGPLSYGEHARAIRAVFSPDASRLVTTSLAGHARVWSVPEGEMLLELTGHHSAPLVSAMFSPDGLKIVTASDDGTAAIWGAESGELLQALHHGGDAVVYAEFSPDSRSVATASLDGTARVWDAEKGLPRGAVMRHEDHVHLVRFSPDGHRVLTASVDQTGRVWDAQTGLPLSEPLRHDGIVADVEFNREGNRVATAGFDTTARLWDLPPAPAGPVPGWVADWGEAVAGLQVDPDGSIKPVDPERRREVMDTVLALPDDGYYANTAKWFYADLDKRPITPFSRIGLGEWVANRVQENTVTSLEEALRVAPDDTAVQLALAHAIMGSQVGEEAVNLRRAAALAMRVPPSSERAQLLAQIEVTETRHALSKRVAQIDADAKSAVETGNHHGARLLHRPLLVGTILVDAETGTPENLEAIQRMQEIIGLEHRPVTFVESGAEWRYVDSDEFPGPGWTEAAFDDSGWKHGPAPLGFGQGEIGIATHVDRPSERAMCFYFRRTFEAAAVPPGNKLVIEIECDDGAVVYLNGEEASRFNMPDGEISHGTPAVELRKERDRSWTTEIDPRLLRPGRNLIAVEVHQKHQSNKPSSDMRMSLALSARVTREAFLAGLSELELRDALSQLTFTLSGEQSSRARARWGAAVLPDAAPNSTELLDLRATVQQRLGRWQDALAAIESLIARLPADPGPADVRIQADLLRRKAACQAALGQPVGSDELAAQLLVPPRNPSLDPRLVDLTASYNRPLFQRDTPAVGSEEYWLERLPELYQPGEGEGPEFDLRGFVQLNSGTYRETGDDYATRQSNQYPDNVSIAVGQTCGAIHFLQSSARGEETFGKEVARYIVRYDDGSHQVIPVRFGREVTDYWINNKHANLKAAVNLVVQQRLGSNWGQLTWGFALQSWTNPHPAKTVSHIDFVSAKAMAAPLLAGITLEPREEVERRTAGFDDELASLGAELGSISDLTNPGQIRHRRTLLRQKLALLADLGRHEEAAAVDAEIASVPPRPPGLSPKLIDLSGVYTGSFFRPGPRIARERDGYWERVPESYDPGAGPEFDLRGVIQLDSGVYADIEGPIKGRRFGEHWGIDAPASAEIPVGQTFTNIHFLHTVLFGREDVGATVARYVLCYDDGSREEIPVKYGIDIVDNAVGWYNPVELRQIKDLALSVRIPSDGWGGHIAFTRQAAENPHPEKLVTHIEFQSALKLAAPCLAGVTVE